MILVIGKFLVWILGFIGIKIDVTKAQKIAVIGLIVILGIIVLIFVFSLRSCFKKEAKIDLEQVEKINKANEADRKKELQKIIEDNADVVSTADNRTAIAETNVIERDRLIDEKVKAVDKKIAEARAGGKDITGPELECILIPENCT